MAVIDATGTWTFDDLENASAEIGGALLDSGVRRGDRVAIALPDGRDWCAAFLGATRIGAVAAPLEPGGRHRDAVLGELDPATVIAETSEALPSRWVRVSPAEMTGADPIGVVDVDPGDLAYMIFSSGSTGRPKGAMHAHRDLATSVEGYARDVLGLAPGDRCHSVAPLFASLGFGNGFFRPLGRGAACVMSRTRVTVRSIGRLIADHGVTVLTGVPTFWSQLATFLERHPDPDALTGVRLAVSSGDSLPAPVLARLETLTGVPLIEGLGCSECSNVVISNSERERIPGALGRAVAGVDIRLADDDGEAVPAGAPGRLWIRSPSNTTGYWNRPDETAELVHGEWIRMGDVLRVDEGVYRHLGRSDDLFKVDAKWVSPVEVEGILHEHPDVAEAAVVGLPDENGLLRSAAFVVANPGADAVGLPGALRRHVAHRLAAFMAPVTVTLLDELPRGATGKVDRRALRGSPARNSFPRSHGHSGRRP
jgi:acyl-coenzyme A synthetase/AMP-(fatty) acid ligase